MAIARRRLGLARAAPYAGSWVAKKAASWLGKKAREYVDWSLQQPPTAMRYAMTKRKSSFSEPAKKKQKTESKVDSDMKYASKKGKSKPLGAIYSRGNTTSRAIVKRPRGKRGGKKRNPISKLVKSYVTKRLAKQKKKGTMGQRSTLVYWEDGAVASAANQKNFEDIRYLHAPQIVQIFKTGQDVSNNIPGVFNPPGSVIGGVSTDKALNLVGPLETLIIDKWTNVTYLTNLSNIPITVTVEYFTAVKDHIHSLFDRQEEFADQQPYYKDLAETLNYKDPSFNISKVKGLDKWWRRIHYKRMILQNGETVTDLFSRRNLYYSQGKYTFVDLAASLDNIKGVTMYQRISVLGSLVAHVTGGDPATSFAPAKVGYKTKLMFTGHRKSPLYKRSMKQHVIENAAGDTKLIPVGTQLDPTLLGTSMRRVVEPSDADGQYEPINLAT